jgi:hypothetical protein
MQEMMTTNQERIETEMDTIQEKDTNLRENMVEMKDGWPRSHGANL